MSWLQARQYQLLNGTRRYQDDYLVWSLFQFETEYLNREVRQISVFMSPVNVHINWTPIAGLVTYYKYHAGKYLVAWHPKSSTENERHSVVYRKNGKEILVKQIAGAVAKRIGMSQRSLQRHLEIE